MADITSHSQALPINHDVLLAESSPGGLGDTSRHIDSAPGMSSLSSPCSSLSSSLFPYKKQGRDTGREEEKAV